MQGSSRGAEKAGTRALEEALGSGADATALAEDLLGAAAAIDANPTLRRALGDPSREAEAKRGLATAIFGGKVGEHATTVLAELAAQRWAGERDLGDTVEVLGVEALLASAESAGRLEDVEDELFRFERTVAGNTGLRDAVTNRFGDRRAKDELVRTLLEGKAAPETVRLARQAVLAPRGRRFDRTVEEYLALAADRRERLTAVVTTAVPLGAQARERLERALAEIYSHAVQLQVVVDPAVVGGLRVRVGDEVIDGTVARRIEDVRRHFAR